MQQNALTAMATSEQSSGGGEGDGLAELAAEEVAPIAQELRARLTVELGERDALAAQSALLKAFVAGMSAALAEQPPEPVIDEGIGFRALGAVPLETALARARAEELPHPDPWAERYRDGEEAGEI